MHLFLLGLLAYASIATALPASQDQRLQSRASSTSVHRITGSTGCGKPSRTELDIFTYRNITLADKVAPNRRYAYWLPPKYDPNTPAPVIFAFHGGYQSALKQHNLDHFTAPYFNDGTHIIVYPEAWVSPLFGPEGRIWQISPVIADLGVDDVKYTMAVLDEVLDDFCIDDRRVYSAGMSQGGGFTNMLACDPVASTRFAAFAPVAGSYFYPSLGRDVEVKCYFKHDPLACNPGRKGIPIMATHGGSDDTIPYGGGYNEQHDACFPNLDHWLALWAERNELDGRDVRTVTTTWDDKKVPGRKQLGSDAQRRVFGLNDDPRGLVTMVHSGSRVPHNWPRTFQDDESGWGMASFNVSSMIFEFFSRFQLPSDDTAESGSPSSVIGPQVQPAIIGSGVLHQQDTKLEQTAPGWTTGRVWPSLVHIVVEAIGGIMGWP